MRFSLKRGFSFGLASGVITTLGLMIGLDSATASKLVVLGGVLTIAVADALSDALGIHISVEAETKYTTRHIWESTFAAFLSKFFFALTFAVPVLLLNLKIAVFVSVIWGLFLISVFSFYLAKKQKIPAYRVIFEHLFIAVIVIFASFFVGKFVALYFV
ncbi:hypothetical protein DRJ22_01160 [Candidatus Woesearchaeota archaeon]|nr:MAG: hypothetical protein B6U93_02695 [Candidatus Woesearchaeota archaeon ex4484_78]RLE46760.1 MAG: hypothetical protein DRJ22_01160 [Candidatus Woesearchaeota archaeon]